LTRDVKRRTGERSSGGTVILDVEYLDSYYARIMKTDQHILFSRFNWMRFVTKFIDVPDDSCLFNAWAVDRNGL